MVIEDNGVANNLGGNINADPLFLDATSGDYRLQAGSPAIDAGIAYFELNGRVLVDLAPAAYNGTAPDQGAFESDVTAPQNLPPVAVAAANPGTGSAPLTVQFSADGSYDPDGTIASYAWDFGDGSTSTEANPLKTYAEAGTYNAVLTVSDEAGATDSAQVTIIVDQPSMATVHVQDQVITRLTYRRWARARDIVLVTDQDNQPVTGAVVTARYWGPSQGQVTGTTDSDGTVALETDWQKKPKETWCFEVLDIVADGYEYDPGADVVTIQCESN
jgi:PKD repeat protein